MDKLTTILTFVNYKYYPFEICLKTRFGYVCRVNV